MFLYKVLGLLEQEDAFHNCFDPGKFCTPFGLHSETEAGCLTLSPFLGQRTFPRGSLCPVWVSHSLTGTRKIFSFILET